MGRFTKHEAHHRWDNRAVQFSFSDIVELNLDIEPNPNPRRMAKTHGLAVHYAQVPWNEVSLDELFERSEHITVKAVRDMVMHSTAMLDNTEVN
jgi:hypothetical protein